MTATPALLPCPFCGSARLSDECTGAAEISGHTYQTGWIECLDCGCDGPSVDLTDETPAQNDYQLVRDAWNRRSAPAQSTHPADASKSGARIDTTRPAD